jgi:hypothetical protein
MTLSAPRAIPGDPGYPVDIEGMAAGPISFDHTDHRPQGNEWIYYLHQGTLTYGSQASLRLDRMWLGY